MKQIYSRLLRNHVAELVHLVSVVRTVELIAPFQIAGTWICVTTRPIEQQNF